MDKILLVDDHALFLEEMTGALSEFFEVKSTNSSLEAVDILGKDEFKAIVIDLHMPMIDGFSLIEKIREHSRYNGCPILLLSGSLNNDKKIQALRIEFDEVLSKSMSVDQIVVRIKNRIAHFKKHFTSAVYTIGNLKINREIYEVQVNSETISLTKNEIKILIHLAEKVGTIVPRDEIVSRIWPGKEIGEGALNTHISNLRKKINEFNGVIRCIREKGVTILPPEAL